MTKHTISSAFQATYSTINGDNRVLGLWDMIKLDELRFLGSLTYISSALGEHKLMLQVSHGLGSFSIHSTIDQRAHLIKKIQILEESCRDHNLLTAAQIAQKATQDCLEALAGENWSTPHNLQRVVISLEGLINTAVTEAKTRKLYVLAGDVKENHDDADTLFGSDVIDVFPNAAFDISEAGKCLSFGLWTACVMHTMRVLEIGLQALARHVNVEPSENWNKTLNEIEAELRKVRGKVDGRSEEAWAAEAGTHLRFVKNAWRNQAMHHVVMYDEQKAKAIFDNAQTFMQHIAEKISQDR